MSNDKLQNLEQLKMINECIDNISTFSSQDVTTERTKTIFKMFIHFLMNLNDNIVPESKFGCLVDINQKAVNQMDRVISIIEKQTSMISSLEHDTTLLTSIVKRGMIVQEKLISIICNHGNILDKLVVADVVKEINELIQLETEELNKLNKQ